MNPTDAHIANRGGGPAPGGAPAACERRDLADWAERGGALPARLSAHVARCPGCADLVRRVSDVHASLTLLQTRAVPNPLPARANNRALRMLRRAARASAAAAKLLRTQPRLPLWQRVQLHVMRASLATVVAVFFLIMRIGLLGGIERTQEMGEQLADAHWQRHIDPTGEWLDRHDTA